ncbi:MAG: DUF615 domain-containing protein [Deltaproteobacteria bacterium]|nr:MAG: DUF615 domain-containing protein [Deltaproteobacteria bacterium]
MDERPDRQERRTEERQLVKRAREVVVALLKLTEAEALALPLDDAVARSVGEYYRIPSRGDRARSRLKDRLVREVRLTNLDELELVLGLGEAARTAKDDAMIALEQQRNDLLDGGDEALDALLEQYPDANRQQLRALIRQARKDGGRGKAFKRLFAELRTLNGL